MEKQTKFEDYSGFVEKFKPKKTTDDCYTPPLVYGAIANWVAKEYGLNKADFVRPFYPGGGIICGSIIRGKQSLTIRLFRYWGR